MKQARILPTALALAATLLLHGCGSDDNVDAPTQTPVSVTVLTAEPNRDEQGRLVISGQVAAEKRAELSTRVMGTMLSLPVEEGQYVRQGQVLGQVRSTDIQASSARVDAQIAEVEAVVANAKRDLERYETLFAKGSATQKELDDVRTGYARALAQLQAAQKAKTEAETQLGYATLVAPFAGYITHIYMQQGALATPGMPILTIEGGSGFKLVARVAETDIAHIRTGQKGLVTVEALGESFPAQVARITPSTTFTGAQYEVTLLAKTYPKALKAGMFLRVSLEQTSTTPAATNPALASTWVPDSAVVHRGGLQGLYVVSPKNEALLRWVRTGKSSGGRVEVLSGLAPGDRYVVHATGKIEDGTPVTVTLSPAAR